MQYLKQEGIKAPSQKQLDLIRNLEKRGFEIFISATAFRIRHSSNPTEYTEIEGREIDTLGMIDFIELQPFLVRIKRFYSLEEMQDRP